MCPSDVYQQKMFTSAVIACLIEIINVPPAEPLPIGLAHDDLIRDNGFIGPEDARAQRLRDAARDSVSGFLRIMLMLATSACYIASVRTRNIGADVTIVIGAIMSFRILLF